MLQHRCGGDGEEVATAAPVDPKNRLTMQGPFREIEVSRGVKTSSFSDLPKAWTAFDFPGRSEKVSSHRASGYIDSLFEIV